MGEESFRRGVRVWCRRAHFRSDAAQRYIRAQKTRSKCRRRFTALHHHTRTSRLRFLRSQFQIQTRRNEGRTLLTDTRLYSALLFESRCISLFQKRKSDKHSATIEKFLSLFLFVEFEIIGSSAGWMRVENAWIQTAGYAFRRAAGEILGDFGAEFSKTKTPGAGVRIFNGAVRTEREFPLKILFLACIQGLVFYLFCGTEIKISPTALRIRFLFTLYQSIFEPLFSHMLLINSNLYGLIRFPVLPLRLRLSRILQCLHLQHSCL